MQMDTEYLPAHLPFFLVLFKSRALLLEHVVIATDMDHLKVCVYIHRSNLRKWTKSAYFLICL